MDIEPKFIKAEGAELVILTRSEFDALMALAAEAEEDADDLAKYDARKAEMANGKASHLPAEVSALLLRGDSLLKSLRKWRKLTQVELAQRTGMAQGYLSDLESGRRAGTRETLNLIAEKLEVDPAWLAPNAE
jgi:DNA-binding Xre family transcriptional regulator